MSDDYVNVTYYAHLGHILPDETVDNPQTVYRRSFRADGGSRDEFFSVDGEWEKTEYWIKLHFRGETDGEVVEISPERASAIIHRWYDEGRRPRVAGVDLPPLGGSSGEPGGGSGGSSGAGAGAGAGAGEPA